MSIQKFNSLHEALQHWAEQTPDAVAFIDQRLGRTFTFAQTEDLVEDLSEQTFEHLRDRLSELANTSAKVQGFVYVLAHKGIELPIAYLALSRVGLIGVPLHQHMSRGALVALREILPPLGVLTTEATRKHLPDSLGDLLHLEVCPAGNLAVLSAGESLLAKVPGFDGMYVNLTSGTTGLPKAVLASEEMIRANTLACLEHFDMDADDVHLCTFAASAHPHELFARSLYSGATSVLLDTFFPKSLVQAVTRNRVTCLMGVASVYELLLQFAESPEFDVSGLRVAEVGGMPTTADLAQRWLERTGFTLSPVWGSTETTGVALGTPPGEYVTGSVGIPLPGYTARLLGEDGTPLPEGNGEGELELSGPAVTDGYVRSEPGGRIIRTGDMFARRNGRYFFLGRKDGMMKVAGSKVFPQEIEAVLLEHPAVDEACVVPRDDPRKGVTPRAFVVLSPGEKAGPDYIREYLRKRLSPEKQPSSIEFRDALPRTPMGKLDRKTLADEPYERPPESMTELRHIIERCDKRILALLNERAKAAQKITKLKQDRGQALFVPSREAALLEEIAGHNTGPLYDSAVKEIFRVIMSTTFTLPALEDAPDSTTSENP